MRKETWEEKKETRNIEPLKLALRALEELRVARFMREAMCVSLQSCAEV
jgi:hypothetical protein